MWPLFQGHPPEHILDIRQPSDPTIYCKLAHRRVADFLHIVADLCLILIHDFIEMGDRQILHDILIVAIYIEQVLIHSVAGVVDILFI